MGSFKQKNMEGVRTIRENSREATDLGQEMNREAQEINAILESITLQDSEDVQAINETGNSYQGSFDNAFDERVETAGQQIEQQGNEIKDTVNNELGNVRSGISSLERAGGVSEIGRDAAERGRSSLERSASEYEGIVNDATETVDETRQKINDMKRNLSSAFRR